MGAALRWSSVLGENRAILQGEDFKESRNKSRCGQHLPSCGLEIRPGTVSVKQAYVWSWPAFHPHSLCPVF